MKRSLIITFLLLTIFPLYAQWRGELLFNELDKKTGLRWAFPDHLPGYRQMTIKWDDSVYDSLDGHLIEKKLSSIEEHVVHGDSLTIFHSSRTHIGYICIYNSDSTLRKVLSDPQLVPMVDEYFYQNGKLKSSQSHGIDTNITYTTFTYRANRLVGKTVSSKVNSRVIEYRFHWKWGRLRSQSFSQSDSLCYWKYSYADHGRTIRCFSNIDNEALECKLTKNGKYDTLFRYRNGKCVSVDKFEYYPDGRLKSRIQCLNGKRVQTETYSYE